jgi:cell division protein FtsB
MVVRYSARRFLIPLALYALAAALVGYFIHHAHTGKHGLEAKMRFKAQSRETFAEFEAVQTERKEWERRIALLRADQIDRDLLEERARVMLGRVHRNDLVIMTGP